MGMGGKRHALATLPPKKTRLVGPQGLRGKSRPHPDSVTGPSSPWRVLIPTELFQPVASPYTD
jgi:hypothetical protein